MKPWEKDGAERVTLEHLKVGSQYVADQAEWDFHKDRIRGRMILKLHSYVLADKLVTDEYHCLRRPPRSPWQDLKDRRPWLQKLFGRVKRIDVRFTVHVDRYLTYPDASIRIPELGRPIIFEQLTEG